MEMGHTKEITQSRPKSKITLFECKPTSDTIKKTLKCYIFNKLTILLYVRIICLFIVYNKDHSLKLENYSNLKITQSHYKFNLI